MKPSRSEDLGSPEEQLRVSQQVHDFFEATAPRRPHKPSRSDDDQAPDPPSATDLPADIPELHKFQDLEAQPDRLDFTGNGVVRGEDEVTETNYYKYLAVVEGSQHHTTGTGYIHVASEGAEDFHIAPEGLHPLSCRTGSKSNPATNVLD